MLINNFNGGLNTRINSKLIKPNEAIEYNNIDSGSSILKAIKGSTNLSISVYKYIFNFNASWVASNNYADYVFFQQKLYSSSGTSVPLKTSDGSTYYNLGIKEPAVSPSLVLNAGVLTGNYYYCYTYYNSADGTESQPSPYAALTALSSNSVDITITASTDAQVDIVKIYRVGGNLPSMSLVGELTIGSTAFTDNLDDISIPGYILNSQLYGQAPSMLNYLTESNSMLFGAVTDKLYFSGIGLPNTWSPYDFIDFPYSITGIGDSSFGLLVFTEFTTYIVVGNSPDTFSRYLLSNNQGCINHKSIKYMKNILLWASTDGICSYNGKEINVISRNTLDKITLNNITDSVVYDDVYYLAYDTTRVLVMDVRFGLVFRTISIAVDSFHVYNDTLYYSSRGALYTMFTDTKLAIKYRSPEFTEGQSSNLKSYKYLHINIAGSLYIEILIDGTKVYGQTISDNIKEIKIPHNKRRGYSIQFIFSGFGEVIEYQYSIEGRKND